MRLTVAFQSAADDFQNSDKLRSLLKDIREARQAKSREGLSKLDHSELSVRRTSLSFMGTCHSQNPSAAKPVFNGNQRNPTVFHSIDGRLHKARTRSRGPTSRTVILMCRSTLVMSNDDSYIQQQVVKGRGRLYGSNVYT